MKFFNKINFFINKKVEKELNAVTMSELVRFTDYVYENYSFYAHKLGDNKNTKLDVYEVLNEYLKPKTYIKKNGYIDWVFWINISIRKKWFRKLWKTRGANFLDIQFFCFYVTIGMPWLNTYLTYENYIDSNIYNTNMENLKNKFSFLVKSKF
jgi:hypothetical protein